MQTFIAWLAVVPLLACGKTDSAPTAHPPGEPKKTETTALELGGSTMQRFDPIRTIDVYLNGFHVMKDKPELVMEAHHYCMAKSEEVMQCTIFDGNTKDANLIGVEYIISEALFAGLPEGEKKLWHPHNYEILSGELIAPGLPEVAEKALLRKKMNSYGKTWHIWDTGHLGHPVSERLPTGTPMLAWSFNADGEVPPALVAHRDERLGVHTADKRAERADLISLARPQQGINALAKTFPNRALPSFVMGE